MAKKKFYAVKVGINPGIYNTWDECKSQVAGFKGCDHHSFKTLQEAEAYMRGEEPATEEPIKEEVSNEAISIYVDGSFSNNYGWGLVVVENGEAIHEECGVGDNPEAAKMWNVAGELAAAMRAVLWARKNNKKVVIHHDLEGTEFWVTGRFSTKNEFTAAYVKFMEKHKDCYTFKKIKAHSGDKWNDYADDLSRSALGI